MLEGNARLPLFPSHPFPAALPSVPYHTGALLGYRLQITAKQLWTSAPTGQNNPFFLVSQLCEVLSYSGSKLTNTGNKNLLAWIVMAAHTGMWLLPLILLTGLIQMDDILLLGFF